MRRETRLAAAAATALTVALTGSAPAFADTSSPTWNCRASVAQAFGTSADPRFEPLVANGNGADGSDRPACADDQAGVPSIDSPDGSVHAQGPFAATDVTPDVGAARDQKVVAGATATDILLKSPDGAHSLAFRAIYSQATARCVNGVPQLTGASQVVGFSGDGQQLPVDDVLTTITTNFNNSPLGGIVKVLFNQQTRSADGKTLTQQAVRVEFLSIAGSPQGTVVLGETKVSQQGDTCAPPADGTSGTGTGTGTNTVVVTQTQPSPAAQQTAPSPGTANQVGSSNAVRPVVINGQNGGCAHVKMWFSKVADHGTLKGHPHTGRSAFGTRVVLRGKLISCTGKPVVGARMDQIHAFGGKHYLKTGLRSRAGGDMTLILPMNVASRVITIAYRGDLASGKITSHTDLRLLVHDRRGRTLKRPPRYSLK